MELLVSGAQPTGSWSCTQSCIAIPFFGFGLFQSKYLRTSQQ